MNKRSSAKIEKRKDRQSEEMGFRRESTSKGLVVDPQYAIVISLIYIGIVIILHMIGKFRKDNTITPPPAS